MRRILTTLKEKWPEYILEIVVLIIGIYGAFELDSLKEESDSRQQYQAILINIKADLQNDIQEIDSAMIAFDQQIKILEKVVRAQVSKEELVQPKYLLAMLGYKDVSIDHRGIDLLNNFVGQHTEMNIELSNKLAYFYNNNLNEISIDIQGPEKSLVELYYIIKKEDWYLQFRLNQPKGLTLFAEYAFENQSFRKDVSYFLDTFRIYLTELQEYRNESGVMLKEIDNFLTK